VVVVNVDKVSLISNPNSEDRAVGRKKGQFDLVVNVGRLVCASGVGRDVDAIRGGGSEALNRFIVFYQTNGKCESWQFVTLGPASKGDLACWDQVG
jgi:hypothetical protein